jgi:hypothetical protein
MTKNSREPLGSVLARGAFGRCPRCGHGKLFNSYLKQVDHCAACTEQLGHIRADDGPAWLTILLTGHILVPLILALEPNSDWPGMGVDDRVATSSADGGNSPPTARQGNIHWSDLADGLHRIGKIRSETTKL